MSDSSPNLNLPLIQAAQAQKHVTHNEAVAFLDVLAQLVVQDVDATTPPDAPQDGQAWLVGSGATGEWAGADGRIAAWLNGGWVLIAPRPGWIAVDAATGALRIFGASGWQGPALADVAGLGIGATADDDNRLIVSGPATLLTHAGGDHRLTVNKADAGATGSLVFQSAYSGRAEMGLAGEDAFSIKVSANGANWTTALRVDPDTGTLNGAAVQDAPDDTTPGRLMRADWGYGPGNVLGPVALEDDRPTGAIIETSGDATARYTKFADGTLICTGAFPQAQMTLDRPAAGGFAAPSVAVDFPLPFAEPPVVAVNLDPGTDALPFDVYATPGQARYSPWSATGGAVTAAARYVATGRWA